MVVQRIEYDLCATDIGNKEVIHGPVVTKKSVRVNFSFLQEISVFAMKIAEDQKIRVVQEEKCCVTSFIAKPFLTI